MPYRVKEVPVEKRFRLLDVMCPLRPGREPMSEPYLKVYRIYQENLAAKKKVPNAIWLDGRVGVSLITSDDGHSGFDAITFTARIFEDHPWFDKPHYVVSLGVCDLLDEWRKNVHMSDAHGPVIVYDGKTWQADHIWRQD